MPTLTLWGKADKMTPIADAHYIKSALAESKLVTYKDQGHRLPYEKPVRLAKEIELWSKQLH